MRSLPPKDYAQLPRLLPPAGYVLVVRDIDSDSLCINRAQRPAAFIETLFAERGGAFGLELVAMLKSADVAASEAALFEAHGATFSADWLRLDRYQIEELRRSALSIDAHESCYLLPRRARKPPAPAPPPAPAETDRLEPPAFAWRDAPPPSKLSRSPSAAPVYRPYGEGALRRARPQPAPQAEAPRGIRQSISDRFEDLMVHHPWTLVVLLAVVALLLFIFLSGQPRYGHQWIVR